MSQGSETEELDLLAFAAHPDDAELNAGGLIAKMVRLGHKVGIVDLTAGQMASRGSASQREVEAAKATQILGLTVRENLGLADGELSAEDPQAKRKVVEVIRKYRPKVVLAGLEVDRHPDHYRGGQLVSDAAWLADRVKYDTAQERHQIKRLCYYPEHFVKEVSFVVDISEDFETKRRAVMAFSSQFYNWVDHVFRQRTFPRMDLDPSKPELRNGLVELVNYSHFIAGKRISIGDQPIRKFINRFLCHLDSAAGRS